MTAATMAREILRQQRMPPEEIRAVLEAHDPLLVRRLLELHRERLEEWLGEQRSLLAWIERSLGVEDRPRLIPPAPSGQARDVDAYGRRW